MIAGLEEISDGELLIDGKMMNQVTVMRQRYCNGVSELCTVPAYDRI